MGKNHPDDLVSATSKLLKTPKTPTLRFTFKRGSLWQPQFAKAHSRKAKSALKQELKAQALAQGQEQGFPLLARLRTNEKEDNIRLSSQTRPGKGTNVIESLLGVFRVNFFKKKGEDEEKQELKVATRPDPNSKSSLRRKQKTVLNQQRRKKRMQLKREARRTKRTGK